MSDSNDPAQDIGGQVENARDIEPQAVTSDFKVLGELDSDNGVGVLGQNNATSGTPIGVWGAVPEPGIGYGLYTLDGAKIDGTTELSTLSGSLTGGQSLTDIAGDNLSINSGSLDAASGSDTRTDVSNNGTTVVSNTTDINFASNVEVTDDTDGSVTVDASDTRTDVSDSGAAVVSDATEIDFSSNLSVTDNGGGAVTVDSTDTDTDTRTDIADDGSSEQTNTETIDFVGASDVDPDGSGGAVVNEVWTDGDADTMLAPNGTSISVVGIEEIEVVRSDTNTHKAEVTESGSTLRVQKFESGTDHNGNTTANVVLGSEQNLVWNDALGATIAGGGNQAGSGLTGNANDIGDHYGTISGGLNNKAGNGGTDTDPTTAMFASVGGGRNNRAEATAATVPGGVNNIASGNYSLAAGREADASDGSFVWGDSSTTSVNSGTDEFIVQAGGGATIYTSSDLSSGVTLASGGNTWNNVSSRARKNSITPVDPTTVLDGVNELELTTWEYDSQDDVTHMGPMAEDFHDQFGLGYDEERIATVDADGVALAAIQGLSAELDEARQEIDEARSKLDEKDARIETLEAERDAFRDRLAEVEDRLARLESGPTSAAPADD